MSTPGKRILLCHHAQKQVQSFTVYIRPKSRCHALAASLELVLWNLLSVLFPPEFPHFSVQPHKQLLGLFAASLLLLHSFLVTWLPFAGNHTADFATNSHTLTTTLIKSMTIPRATKKFHVSKTIRSALLSH